MNTKWKKFISKMKGIKCHIWLLSAEDPAWPIRAGAGRASHLPRDDWHHRQSGREHRGRSHKLRGERGKKIYRISPFSNSKVNSWTLFFWRGTWVQKSYQMNCQNTFTSYILLLCSFIFLPCSLHQSWLSTQVYRAIALLFNNPSFHIKYVVRSDVTILV